MNRMKRNVVISLILGFMSVLAMGVSHLALTDIWHGEVDVSQEWATLRLAAVVILAFHFSAFATMWHALRPSKRVD